MTMIDPFFFNILMIAIGIAILTGIMGCFVVWRRMAYFGDSLSHSALLGVVIGVLLGINMQISIIFVCLVFSLLFVYLQQNKMLSNNTLLGILAHGSLSFGMVAFSFLDKNINLHSFLFGDILTINVTDIYWIYGVGIGILSVIYYYWSSLILVILSEELAVAEGVSLFWMNVIFMILISLVIALSLQIIGALLITSMLIIPAATARHFAKSLKIMVLLSIFFGILSMISGLFLSLHFDTPTSPTIVSFAVALFIATLPLKIKH